MPELAVHTLHQPFAPGDDEVLIAFIASPINPLDVLVLTGQYPVLPQHKFHGQPVPGYDGVAQVLRCGRNVTALTPGDFAIPSQFGLGTWRSHAVVSPTELQKIPEPKDPIFASLLRLGVSTAYCLVQDMTSLKTGDRIIVNAGTSVVAQFVTQFARRRGVGVIHVVRDRAPHQMDSLRKTLRDAGAEDLLTEEELVVQCSALRKTGKTMLGLDAVFGDSGMAILAALSDGGTFVQLGFLGGQTGRVTLHPDDLFARRLSMKGFRGSAQMALRSAEEKTRLFNSWVDMFNRGDLQLPVLGLGRVERLENESDTDAATEIIRAVNRTVGGLLGWHIKEVVIFKAGEN